MVKDERKTIRVQPNTMHDLITTKHKLKLRSIDETIQHLIYKTELKEVSQ